MSDPDERLRVALAEARDIYDGKIKVGAGDKVLAADDEADGESGDIAGVVKPTQTQLVGGTSGGPLLVDFLRQLPE